MTLKEIKSNLCYYDIRNPNISVDEETTLEISESHDDCFCDNCFKGKTKLAEELLWLYNVANKYLVY